MGALGRGWGRQRWLQSPQHWFEAQARARVHARAGTACEQVQRERLSGGDLTVLLKPFLMSVLCYRRARRRIAPK